MLLLSLQLQQRLRHSQQSAVKRREPANASLHVGKLPSLLLLQPHELEQSLIVHHCGCFTSWSASLKAPLGMHFNLQAIDSQQLSVRSGARETYRCAWMSGR